MNHKSHTTHDQTDVTTFGFWVYIMSDCLLFASLFATFAVLRNNTWGGPSGAELFSLHFVLAETLILLTSSFTCGLAMLALRRGHSKELIALLAATALLGASFVTLELKEFSNLIAEGHGWRESGFLSAFFTLVGTHGLHVTGGLVWMLVSIIQVAHRGISDMTMRRILSLALFWHFLDVVWIFIFTFIYLFGAL